MYAPFSQLENLPIISLQTGETIGRIRKPVIDITNLEIVAYNCENNSKKPMVLMTRDIRQLAADCVIIDNEDEFSEQEDLVRLKDVLSTGYSPIDKTVVSDTGRKLGSVEDYNINLETSRIQKLTVRRSFLRSWSGPALTIDRTQIIDITPSRITVRDTTVKADVIPTPVSEGST
jgi:sporulation protein YlmC with PRC-barrel domain